MKDFKDLNWFEKLFGDRYDRQARLAPGVIFLTPFVAFVCLNIYIFYGQVVSITLSLITVIATFAYSRSIIEKVQAIGHSKEQKIYDKWGGAPTTIFLRHKESPLDQHTLKRYHRRINKLLPELKIPMSQKEKTPNNANDEEFKSATNFVKKQTRNNAKYPLVLSTNINFGFRRNLWSLKPYAIAFLAVCFAIQAFVLYYKGDITTVDQFQKISIEYVASFACLSLFLLYWIFLVNLGLIKTAGFSYAECLFEYLEKEVKDDVKEENTESKKS